VIKRIYILTLLLVVLAIVVLLAACVNTDTNQFEVGSVTLVANGVEHEPTSHMSTGLFISSDGAEMRPSSDPFPGWLERNISTIPIISYADDLQIIVTGRDVVGWGLSVAHEYGDYMVHIPIPVDSPAQRSADVPIPDEPGIYLVHITVQWGSGRSYAAFHYVLRIAR